MNLKFIFGISAGVSAIALLVVWHRDPFYTHVPTPRMTIYLAIFCFFATSFVIFSANLVFALLKGKKAKNEEELQAIIVPAMQARECDERILRWAKFPTTIVSGVCCGAIFAAILQLIMK